MLRMPPCPAVIADRSSRTTMRLAMIHRAQQALRRPLRQAEGAAIVAWTRHHVVEELGRRAAAGGIRRSWQQLNHAHVVIARGSRSRDVPAGGVAVDVGTEGARSSLRLAEEGPSSARPRTASASRPRCRGGGAENGSAPSPRGLDLVWDGIVSATVGTIVSVAEATAPLEGVARGAPAAAAAGITLTTTLSGVARRRPRWCRGRSGEVAGRRGSLTVRRLAPPECRRTGTLTRASRVAA